jgi:hypothetical protein
MVKEWLSMEKGIDEKLSIDEKLNPQDFWDPVAAIFRMVEYLADHGFDFDHPSWVPGLLMRLLTFEALQIRHTCCDRVYEGFECMDDEEAAELRHEDCKRLELLDEIIQEFSRLNKEGSFLEFLRGYWRESICQVLRDLDNQGMTEEEKREAEEIGVEWDAMSVESTKLEISSDEEDIDSLFSQLDEILSKCG